MKRPVKTRPTRDTPCDLLFRTDSGVDKVAVGCYYKGPEDAYCTKVLSRDLYDRLYPNKYDLYNLNVVLYDRQHRATHAVRMNAEEYAHLPEQEPVNFNTRFLTPDTMEVRVARSCQRSPDAECSCAEIVSLVKEAPARSAGGTGCKRRDGREG